LLKPAAGRQNAPMADTTLDARGLSCPMPVLRANRALRSLEAGDKLRVLATDRAAIADFRAFCRETGHQLLSFSEEAGILSFTIRRRPDTPAAASPDCVPAERA
jgi:tRNA 2-thiouridine synthesizing protein A